MEIEVKYQLSNETICAELKTLTQVGDYAISTGYQITFNDTYYDTEYTSLSAAGFALRERRASHDIMVTLKSLTPPIGNLHIREEIEIQSPDIRIDQPNTWQDDVLRHQVWRMTNGQTLQPIFEIHQERFLRNVTKNAVIVAEFCIDRAHFHFYDRELLYLGLEIELTASGTENDLSSIRNALEQTFELIPEKRSKYEIGLAYTQVPTALVMIVESNAETFPDIQPSDSMAVAAMKTFEFHFGMMKSNDAGTYRGEDNIYVHDMRVEVRRMRSAYRVFAPYIHPESSQPYLQVLKKTGNILGTVRDLDVFRENFELYGTANNIPLHTSTLTSAWNSAYTLARNTLLAFLASDRYLEFRASFTSHLDSVVDASQPTPVVADQMGTTLDGQLQQVMTYYRQIKQEEPLPLHHFHQLRILLKHFRYSVEYFRNILGTLGEEIILEMKIIQDHLGALQDAVVAHKKIQTVLQWGSWDAPQQPYTLIASTHNPSPDVQAYLQHVEESIDQLIETFPEAWARFNSFITNVAY